MFCSGGKMIRSIWMTTLIISMFLISTLNASTFKPLLLRVDSLTNGLKIIYLADESKNSFTTTMIYNIGTKIETQEQKGIVSLLAYYLNTETENISFGNLEKLINETGGKLNTLIHYDYIIFNSIVPAMDYKLPLWIESERMRKVIFKPDKFENAKKYAINKLNQAKYKSHFDEQLNEIASMIFEDTFYSHQPYELPSNSNINLQSLKELYDKYIQPNNATLIVTGKFDINSTLQTIRDYFSAYPKTDKPSFKDSTIVLNLENERIIRQIQKNETPSIYICFEMPKPTDSDYLQMNLLNAIIANLPNARLKKILPPNINCEANELTARNSSIVIYKISGNFMDIKKTEELIIEEMRNIATNGITEAELEEAKNYIENLYLQNLIDSDKLCLKLAWFNIFQNNPYLINSTLEKYLKLTLESLNATANKYLYTNNYKTIIYQSSQN